MKADYLKTGVIHGRFQPLHNGHLEYLLAAKKRCDFLYIGITNPDIHRTTENHTDLKRSKTSSNPFTYYERLEMICRTMCANDVQRSEFEVVPFPINYPNLISSYVPMSAVFFITIYDDWGWFKHQELQNLGVDTDIMWIRDEKEKVISGTEIRSRIKQKKDWKNVVPLQVYDYISNRNLNERLEVNPHD